MFDVTLFGALVAGLMSFLSPCILPIVPFYLGYLAGGGVRQITAGGTLPKGLRIKAVTGAVFFALGIITIFVSLGATASTIGHWVQDYFDALRWVAALIIITMGLHFVGVIKIDILYRQFSVDHGFTKSHGLLGAYVMGLAFAFGWTPCVGPVLATILFIAAGQDTSANGGILLFTYGVGMTFPFILAAFFIVPFLKFMARFRRYLSIVEKLMGSALILFGILIATQSLNIIAAWIIRNLPWLVTIG